VGQISGLVGHTGARALQDAIAGARKPASGILATVIGTATLLLGASGVFGELQDSLNTIWGVKPRPGLGLKGFLRTRFVSFTMVLGIAFLLLVSLVLSAALAALGDYLSGILPAPELLLHVVNDVVSFAVITILFAMIFRVLPDVELSWRDVWVGAAITAALFTLGKLGIGLYLGKTGASSGYGAAGALVLILLWAYYSAQILYVGAEMTRVFATRYGSRIRPSPNAVPVTQEARARQGIPPDEPRPTLH
jgi:membrane protein